MTSLKILNHYPSTNSLPVDLNFSETPFEKCWQFQLLLYQLDESNIDIIIDSVRKLALDDAGEALILYIRVHYARPKKRSILKEFFNKLIESNVFPGIKDEIKHVLKFAFSIKADAFVYDCLDSNLVTEDEIHAVHPGEITQETKSLVNQSELATAIRDDDLEALTRLSADADFTAGQEIRPVDNEVHRLLVFNPSLLQYAAFFGSEKCFSFLLNEKFADLYVKTPDVIDGVTHVERIPLSPYAVSGGNPKIMKVLDDNEIHASLFDIRSSIVYHQVEIFNKLLIARKSLKIDQINDCIQFQFINGLSKQRINVQKSFLQACKWNFLSFVKFIIGKFDIYIYEGLNEACFNGSYHVVKYLLTIPNMDVNLYDSDTFALLEATHNEHIDIVELLLQCPDIKVNQIGQQKDGKSSPLIEACKNNNIKLVKMFLDFPGINPNIETEEGDFALLIAAKLGYIDIIRLFIEKGLDINYQTNSFPLAEACRNGHNEIVKLLIDSNKLRLQRDDLDFIKLDKCTKIKEEYRKQLEDLVSPE